MSKAALYVIIGTLCGAFFTHNYHANKAQSLADAQRKAWDANNESIKISSATWQERLDLANAVEPVVVERRVYVKAPLPATKCNAVDDGGSTLTYRIDGATVRELEQLTARAEQQYRECSYRLRAWQETNSKPQ